MRLKSVFVRFYKSFNYDYIRKVKPDEIKARPWEMLDDKFYPFVEIPIDPKITTIVGANESGKSHLLTAIEKGITGKSEHCKNGVEISRKDFCRYSHFFKSTTDEPKLPDFGFEWTNLEKDESDKIREICGMKEERKFNRFLLFRFGTGNLNIYISKQNNQEGFDPFEIENIPIYLMPNIFRIDSTIALPDSISIERLIKGRYEEDEPWENSGRELSFSAADSVPKIRGFFAEIIKAVTNNQTGQLNVSPILKEEAQQIDNAIATPVVAWREDELEKKAMQFNLAYDLIFKIAKINVEDIKMMRDALRKGESGIFRSVVNNINEALRKHLNFPRIWAQDKDFQLRVDATDHELHFIISDRTGRDYSFDERSSGLRHFLSYYVQYLTHEYQGRSEILLMDEPDAFLSGEAQQDLLKIFDMFANPSQGRVANAVPVQVIYVTHSPFLIDKNHSERVRALEKSEGSKGTRVISRASQNHYEPLRSAFGSFVGETTFISGCNLMVEGDADQILIAGAANYLRRLEDVPESQLLDLNHITIVPCSGAQNVPYLAYLARGRDAEKPAVIVLLDSDPAGNDAKTKLSKAGSHPNKKEVIKPNLILQLGDIKNDDIEKVINTNEKYIPNFNDLEDLVPLQLSVLATHHFLKTVYDLSDSDLEFISEDKVAARKQDGESSFKAIQHLLIECSQDKNSTLSNYNLTIDKVPFARSVVDLLPELEYSRRQDEDRGKYQGLQEFETNMRALFYKLRLMQVEAERDVKDKRMRQKVSDKIKAFLNDHLINRSVTRDDAARLLHDVESDLDGDDTEITFIVQECNKLRKNHSLTEALFENVRDFDNFIDGLERIKDVDKHAYNKAESSVEPRIKPQLSSDSTNKNQFSIPDVESTQEQPSKNIKNVGTKDKKTIETEEKSDMTAT
jgi:predicted ATP-dependent endonuclease of OLD family